MPSRSKTRRRRPEPTSDPLEALKPMLVLGLLGMILYGAYTVVQQGKRDEQLDEAPAFVKGEDNFSAPTVHIPEPSTSAVGTTQDNVDNSVVSQEPTYLNAIPASPPATGDVPSQAMPLAVDHPSSPESQSPPSETDSVVPSTLSGPTVPGMQQSQLNNGAHPSMPTVDIVGATPDPLATESGLAQPSASQAAELSSTQPQQRKQPSAFASAWADAHEKLANGRYVEALAVLSAWYDDPTLGIEESQRLEDLLGQLAGTVIYSQEDLLLPPHIVAPGDTLQTIAMTVGVPWQLLGKINGVDTPDSLLPGEAIKLVRGPFDAVVSVSRRRLSLQLGGNYAGSFPVVIGRRLQERVGVSLSVLEVNRGTSPASQDAIASQVSYVEQNQSPKSTILLNDGLRIEAIDDSQGVSDQAPDMSLVVPGRDLAELIDILGPGSSVLVRQ